MRKDSLQVSKRPKPVNYSVLLFKFNSCEMSLDTLLVNHCILKTSIHTILLYVYLEQLYSNKLSSKHNNDISTAKICFKASYKPFNEYKNTAKNSEEWYCCKNI